MVIYDLPHSDRWPWPQMWKWIKWWWELVWCVLVGPNCVLCTEGRLKLRFSKILKMIVHVFHIGKGRMGKFGWGPSVLECIEFVVRPNQAMWGPNPKIQMWSGAMMEFLNYHTNSWGTHTSVLLTNTIDYKKEFLWKKLSFLKKWKRKKNYIILWNLRVGYSMFGILWYYGIEVFCHHQEVSRPSSFFSN